VLFERAGLGAEQAYDYLGNAAFATVGDITPLRDENRSIVKLGLRAIANTTNPGLNALMERLKIDRTRLSAYHIGFLLGPCFNASGRLDTAVDAIALMEEMDPNRAIARAAELVNMNEERKALTKQGDERAFQIIEEEHLDEDHVLVVYIPELHESLAGIVAGHIKERYFRPTFVLTNAQDGGLKGSGRSIPAYSMYDKLHECEEFLSKYGGHPMAAGISMPKENLEGFRKKMNELANLTEKDMTPVVHIDVPMPLSYVTEELIHELDLLEPFGNGNEKPIFAVKHAPVKRISYMGKENQFLRFILGMEDGREMTALYFRGSEELEQEIREVYGDSAWDSAMRGMGNDIHLTITYFPQINEYRGNISLQALITGVKTDKMK
jgi:single-stranded-DNA-specific exonuclease